MNSVKKVLQSSKALKPLKVLAASRANAKLFETANLLSQQKLCFSTSSQVQRQFEGTRYGGTHIVSVMPGDGGAKEMTQHTLAIIEATKAPIHFEIIDFNQDNCSENDYNNAILSFKRNKIALKGALESDFRNPEFRSFNALMRNDLDLFFNVVHVESKGSEEDPPFNMVIVRQNTGGEYSLLEHSPVDGVVEYVKVVTEKETERLAREAFEYAISQGRKKVTCVHKANIQKMSDGLFLSTVRRVAKDYPQLAFNDMIVDNCAMQMASNPGQFDVLLTTNLYGSICQNIACGLAGGAGKFSGTNLGDEVCVFEPATRNPGSRIPENTANPTAMINAGSEMLRFLGLNDQAAMIEQAVYHTTLVEGVRTKDAGGDAKSSDVVRSVLNQIQQQTALKMQS